MAQFVAFADDVEVEGQTVYAVIDGMGAFRRYAEAILAQHGITNLVPDAWYPQQAWLDAFRTISERIGDNTLYAIGRKIPENVQFPPDIQSLEQALQSMDVAYHMNHRRNGRVLFDPTTGAMAEGIGHYGYELLEPRRIRMLCNNPYPCDFDRGIIAAMAERFKPPSALVLRVEHDSHAPCRKQGADSCTYTVRW